MTSHTRPFREDARAAYVDTCRLRAHPRNVRADLGDLRELAESIRYEGVLVPLMAERHGDHLRILHGHRRWAAAQLAGLRRVPVLIVPQHADDEAMFLMLAEDKKRPLTPEDKRSAVLTLRDEFHKTWPEIAERLGYSVPTVRAWALRPYVECPVCGKATARITWAGVAGYITHPLPAASGPEDGARCVSHARTEAERADQTARALAWIEHTWNHWMVHE